LNRKEFFAASAKAGLGCCALALFGGKAAADAAAKTGGAAPSTDAEFISNWLADLFDGLDKELDGPTKVKVMSYCGKGCFSRYDFKQNIARLGKGDVDKLVAAYKKNFEIWREGDLVHIRYGEVSPKCYCPAARAHPVLPNDMHCECTRATHQAVFESALERPIKMEVAESLRRGGKTCHFIAHLA
jgi:hypothetical protein